MEGSRSVSRYLLIGGLWRRVGNDGGSGGGFGPVVWGQASSSNPNVCLFVCLLLCDCGKLCVVFFFLIL